MTSTTLATGTVGAVAPPVTSSARLRVDTIHRRLATFPQSLLLLGIRIGVGSVFFKAGMLKYNSFEFAIRLFRDEYQVPLLDPALAARLAQHSKGHWRSGLGRGADVRGSVSAGARQRRSRRTNFDHSGTWVSIRRAH